MKAAVLESSGEMQCREIETPVPGSGDVLVRVAYCGICGSDIPRVFQGTSRMYPNVLGHEFSGTIAAVGLDVPEAMVGKKVVGVPLIPCMECDDCKQGNYALCSGYDFIGSRRFGALAEYVCIPASNVFVLGDDVDLFQSSFFEPATVAQHALRLSQFEPGKTAAVVGCGTIGIFLAQLLVANGAQRVVGFARRESRIQAAAAAGVPELINTSNDGWLDEAGEFDCVFDTSGNNTLMVQSFALAANNATVCYVGTPKSPMSFSVQEWEQLNRKELHITGSWMSYSSPFPGNEWAEVSHCFSEGKLKVVSEMLDNVYSLDNAADAFGLFNGDATVSGKVLIRCNEIND